MEVLHILVSCGNQYHFFIFPTTSWNAKSEIWIVRQRSKTHANIKYVLFATMVNCCKLPIFTKGLILDMSQGSEFAFDSSHKIYENKHLHTWKNILTQFTNNQTKGLLVTRIACLKKINFKYCFILTIRTIACLNVLNMDLKFSKVS